MSIKKHTTKCKLGFFIWTINKKMQIIKRRKSKIVKSQVEDIDVLYITYHSSSFLEAGNETRFCKVGQVQRSGTKQQNHSQTRGARSSRAKYESKSSLLSLGEVVMRIYDNRDEYACDEGLADNKLLLQNKIGQCVQIIESANIQTA